MKTLKLGKGMREVEVTRREDNASERCDVCGRELYPGDVYLCEECAEELPHKG